MGYNHSIFQLSYVKIHRRKTRNCSLFGPGFIVVPVAHSDTTSCFKPLQASGGLWNCTQLAGPPPIPSRGLINKIWDCFLYWYPFLMFMALHMHTKFAQIFMILDCELCFSLLAWSKVCQVPLPWSPNFEDVDVSWPGTWRTESSMVSWIVFICDSSLVCQI